MTEDQIKHMVNRFLSWRLPENFRPDAGISFKAEFNEHTAWPMKHEPSGTNLFDATQATAMVRHMIDGLAIPAMTGAEHKAPDPRNREEAAQPNGWRDQQAIQDAIGALKYAYRNVSSITAEKVKSEIIPKLEGLVALPPPPPSQESEGS